MAGAFTVAEPEVAPLRTTELPVAVVNPTAPPDAVVKVNVPADVVFTVIELPLAVVNVIGPGVVDPKSGGEAKALAINAVEAQALELSLSGRVAHVTFCASAGADISAKINAKSLVIRLSPSQ